MAGWSSYAYLAAAILFIVGIQGLGSARTARRGNALAAGGMLIAIVATLSLARVVRYEERKGLFDLFGGPSAQDGMILNLDADALLDLRTPRALYLWQAP